MSHPANRALVISDHGLTLIKRFESYCPDWYYCPAGKKTVGYGHVILKSDRFALPMSMEFATSLLKKDVVQFEDAIKKAVTRPLSQQQFDALVSLVFNIGAANFNGSTLLKRLNIGYDNSAAAEFLKWVYANKIKLPGLVKRRTAERWLFLYGSING
jgi:lysozyme